MSPVPWPWTLLTGTTPAPHTPTAPAPAPGPPRPPHARTAPRPTGEPHDRSGTRYPDLTDPTAWPGKPLWLIAESSVIARLADAGGDLQAHRTVHGGAR